MKDVSIYISDKISTIVLSEEESLTFVWDEFLEEDNAISLPSLVEEKAAFQSSHKQSRSYICS